MASYGRISVSSLRYAGEHDPVDMVRRANAKIKTRYGLCRRNFIRFCACLGISSLFSSAAADPKCCLGLPDGMVCKLLGVLSNRFSAGEIGLAYLARAKVSKNPVVIADSIFHDVTRTKGATFAQDSEIGVLLRARVREDFGQGRTIRVGGWVLSETEVRLCALAATAS